MNIRLKPLLPVAGLFLLFLGLACQNGDTPTLPSPVGPEIISPTAVPPQAKELAREFAQAHRQLDQELDQFHADFDTWRQGLVACESDAAREAYRDFANRFNDVSEKARSLSRPASARELADKLIEATEEEAKALRRLRDRWQPGDLSLIEAVADKRSATASAHREVEDEIADLQDGTDPESVKELQEFTDAFGDVQSDWVAFHDDFEALQRTQSGLEAAELLSRLDGLISDFGSISSSVNSLPLADKAEDLAEKLEQTADSHEQALQELKKAVEEAEAGASHSGAFDTFDSTADESQATLKETEKELKDLTENGPAKDTAAVQQFSDEVQDLQDAWNDFHGDFEDWQSAEGDCDRAAVVEKLGQFNLEFSELAEKARDLPSASYLQSMDSLIVEAVEGEEESLRILRQSWEPFGSDVYRAVEEERADSARLRRQASVGVQELLDRFEVASP